MSDMTIFLDQAEQAAVFSPSGLFRSLAFFWLYLVVRGRRLDSILL
jgi:hypothetical protein